MSQDALKLQLRELRDQILNANREIEELKKQLDATARERADLLKEKANLHVNFLLFTPEAFLILAGLKKAL